MTNEDRLKKIKAETFFTSAFHSEPQALVSASDYEWLIRQVKELAEALENIKKAVGTSTEAYHIAVSGLTGSKPESKEDV